MRELGTFTPPTIAGPSRDQSRGTFAGMGAGNVAAVISKAPLEVSQVNGRAAQGLGSLTHRPANESTECRERSLTAQSVGRFRP